MNLIELHPTQTIEGEEMEYTPMNYIMALLNPDHPPVVDGREMTDTKEYLLDALAESKDASTRAYAAYRGRKLDKLVNDPAPEVRAAVARGGHGLNKLIEDPAPVVRAAVASSTNSLSQLDKLASDQAPEVRAVVALRKGYCVQMINDEDPTVQAVAWWALDHGEA